MGTPELNQLLEEAAQRCDTTAASAEAAASAATAVAEHATALGNLASNEADSLHQEMTQAVEAIHHARDQATQSAAAATELLHGLPARVEQIEGEIKALLQAVHDDAQHLDEARLRLLVGAHDSSTMLDSAFQTLDTRIQDLGHRLDTQLAEAETRLAALQAAVKDAQTHVHEEGQKLYDMVAGVGAVAQQGTQAMVFAVQLGLKEIAEQIVRLCNGAIEGHNAMVVAIRQGFTDETPGGGQAGETWLTTAMKPLHDAFSELAQFPEQVKDAVHGPVSEILADGEKAILAFGNVTDTFHRATPQER